MDEKLIRMTLDNIVKKGIKNRHAVLSTLVKGVSYNKMIFMYLMSNDVSELFKFGDVIYVPIDEFEERNAQDIERSVDHGMSTIHNEIECMRCKVTRGYSIGECADAPFWDTKLWVDIEIMNHLLKLENSAMLIDTSVILR